MSIWSLFVGLLGSLLALQDEPPAFRRLQLSDEFHAEGACAGDLNRDGVLDIVAGPFWYEGPEYKTRHTYGEPKKFDPAHYSDNFFAFVRDLDRDGWGDILIVGFPGKQAFWYQNPKGKAGRWQRHLVFPFVDNESPTLGDITGDGREELIFQTRGRFGWAEPDDDPTKPWKFRALSPKAKRGRFTHGLGYGDVNGDGRADLLERKGWWEQPETLGGEWTHHPADFGKGGAQMFVDDLDGDGDGDVITSLAAHGFGLAWFEQLRSEGRIIFRRHLIMGKTPEENAHGVKFAELHALALVDMNGDGRKDIVTGKRYWSHGAKGDPEPGAPAVVYWFERRDGPTFVPHLIDDDSGVGTQVVVRDVNGDKRPDVVVANKKGAFVLVQDEAAAAKAPRAVLAVDADGAALNMGFEAGTLVHWTPTGNAFSRLPVRGDVVHARRSDMKSRHDGAFWVGTYEAAGDGPTGTLTSSAFAVTQPWASFLIGGGNHHGTRAELQRADTGEVIFRASGLNHEELRPVVVDLRKHKGQSILIRLVDDETGHWGHVNFDDFKFWTGRPQLRRVRRQGAPEAAPAPDVVMHAGLAPEAAAKAMTVPDGFSVTLFAGEPDVHQPVGFAIDDRGRLWVAEAWSYPIRRPAGEGRDRIVIFEDEDHDGRFDKKTVFAENLNLVSGIEVGFGGVWVGAAPALLFIADADRDDRPDGPPRVVLDGWGYQDTHETLNAFIWGPDGWLYGCHGVFTHSRVGPPGTPPGDRTKLNAGIWRYHPVKKRFEVFAEGTSNPWGVDFNDQGQAFATACVIPHLYHLSQGGRYVRQAGQHFNPYTYEDIGTIADHLHYAGQGGPHAGNERSGSVGGGHAHCGAMIYLGDSWPDEYRNRIFMGNIHGNRINVDVPEQRGATFTARHGDDFLLANDKWSRLINLRYGPGGSAYMIDWYDKVPCHHRQDVFDKTNGRIYRIAYGEPKKVDADIHSLSDDELVRLQLHRNDWFVRHARRVLQERGPNPAVHDGLIRLLRDHRSGPRALRLLWALHVTGGLTDDLAGSLLSEADEWVRAWTVQLLAEDGRVGPPTLKRLGRLAREDESSVVRAYLASAAGRMPLDDRWDIIAGVASRAEDPGDKTLPLLVWYAAEPLAAHDAERALTLAGRSPLSKLFSFMIRRITSLGEGMGLLVKGLAEVGDEARRAELLRSIELGLRGRPRVEAPAGWRRLAPDLLKSESADVRARAAALSLKFDVARPAAARALTRVLLARDEPLVRRRMALDAIVGARESSAFPALLSLLDDATLREAALLGLASFEDDRAPAGMLAAYPRLTVREKRIALSTLASRPSYGRALLSAVRRGDLPSRDLTADIVRQLRLLDDEGLESELRQVWGSVRRTPAEKIKQIADLTAMVEKLGGRGRDLSRGRALFNRLCAQCHTLFGEGDDVAPDLTGSNRAEAAYIIENIVDPNALIPNEYKSHTIKTSDGKTIAGYIVREEPGSITLRTTLEEVTVARDQIASKKSGGLSVMPEGQLRGFDDAEIADLIAYLGSPAQVPMLATGNSVAGFFSKKDLSLWHGDPKLWSVENEEIVGRSPGLKRNEFLVSHIAVEDFRLRFEVKLAPNGENSGVQFRSVATADGHVKGYQADIGAGWWGKLYDEEGRGVLWKKPGDGHVRPGEWNLYEIVAVGSRIRTAINGKLCVDMDDPKGRRRGIIALQLHSGGPFEIRFRKLWLDVTDSTELETLEP